MDMFKMAGTMGRIFQKFIQNNCTRNLAKINSLQLMVPNINCERTLYSKASLGLDRFEEQREKTKHQLSNLEDKFKARMIEYVADDKNMIFTEDLKNMVHLANSDEDVELIVSMIKRFNKQNKELRFGSFKFGPVVMRLFHKLNRPDLAIECFTSEEFEGFFDQLISYQIYLDLLFENKMYKEVLENFDLINQKQIQGALYPRNSTVLVLAACYKMNNAESLEYAFNCWKKLESTGYYPTRRASTFCAALFLKQGNAEAALEMIANAKNQGYTTVRNIKVLALAEMGRLDAVIPILKSILRLDGPSLDTLTFNRDVIEKLKERFAQEDNPELVSEFNRICQLFEKEGHISNKTLDEQLCSEIQNPPPLNKPYQGSDGYNYTARNYDNRRRPQQYQRQRPGLKDLL